MRILSLQHMQHPALLLQHPNETFKTKYEMPETLENICNIYIYFCNIRKKHLKQKSKTPKTHLKHNVRRVAMAYLVGELRYFGEEDEERIEAALVEALEWKRRGPTEQEAEKGRCLEGPTRSTILQAAALDVVGCSNTLAIADSTYPIRASQPSNNGVGVAARAGCGGGAATMVGRGNDDFLSKKQ
jgi:hypothetical protein